MNCRPGFNFLVCPDSLLCRQEMQNIADSWISSDNCWQFNTIWGDEEPPPSFWKSLSQEGLFSDKIIITVRHAELWTASIWKELTSILARPLEHAWPFFFIENNWEKNKPKIPAHIQKTKPWQFAEKKKWIWQSSGLSAQSIKSFIRQQNSKSGLHLSETDITKLAGLFSLDGQTILNELEKLYLLSEKGKINYEMIDNDINMLESNAFALIKNITLGNLINVWKDIGLANESLCFLLIALFAREFKIYWQLNMGERVYLHPQEAARKRETAKKLGPSKIAKGFATLAATEYKIKSGQSSPEQTLENLAVELINLFRSR